jgi:hypothetical protein
MEVMECESVSKRNDMKKPKDGKKQNYEGRKNIFIDGYLVMTTTK